MQTAHSAKEILINAIVAALRGRDIQDLERLYDALGEATPAGAAPQVARSMSRVVSRNGVVREKIDSDATRRAILSHVRKNPGDRVSLISNDTGIERHVVQYHLKRLVDSGEIRMEGNKALSRYHFAGKSGQGPHVTGAGE